MIKRFNWSSNPKVNALADQLASFAENLPIRPRTNGYLVKAHNDTATLSYDEYQGGSTLGIIQITVKGSTIQTLLPSFSELPTFTAICNHLGLEPKTF